MMEAHTWLTERGFRSSIPEGSYPSGCAKRQLASWLGRMAGMGAVKASRYDLLGINKVFRQQQRTSSGTPAERTSDIGLSVRTS